MFTAIFIFMPLLYFELGARTGETDKYTDRQTDVRTGPLTRLKQPQ